MNKIPKEQKQKGKVLQELEEHRNRTLAIIKLWNSLRSGQFACKDDFRPRKEEPCNQGR